jgi:hypothetical protein
VREARQGHKPGQRYLRFQFDKAYGLQLHHVQGGM